MNILQVISKLDSSDSSQDTLSSTRAFTLKGHKVVVASPKNELVKEIDEVGARHYEVAISSNIFILPIYIFKLAQIISKENINIVHARDPVSAFIAFFASRITQRTLVTTVYNYCIRGIFERSQVWAKNIICQSHTEAHRLEQKSHVPHAKLCVVKPFVDVDKNISFYENNNSNYFIVKSAVPFFSEEARRSFIRTVSILSRNIHRMQVFIADNSHACHRDSAEKLKLLVKRHSLGEIVRFLEDAQDRKPLSKAHLFVQINVDDNISPKPILEAQASGLPVVATRANWVDDYLGGENTAILCDSNDPKELASAVLNLYRNEELREEMKNTARSFVKEDFSIKRITESTLNVYESAIGSKNILIIKIGALGDVILATPSARAIRKRFPKSKIKLLVGLENKEVFANSPLIDEVIVCDFSERDKGLGGILRIAGKLRADGFDIVIDLQNNKRSHLLSFLSCAPERYGYDNGKLSFLLNRKVKDVKTPIDPVEHQSKVLGLLGITDIDKSLELWPEEEDEKWAANFLTSHWVKENAKLIAINLDSSPRWITKLWPVENFVEICDKLAKDFGIRTLLIGRKNKTERIDEFLKHSKCKPINSSGKTTIPRLASLIKRCDLLVSPDSAPIHVASGMKTPFIALFGPTDPRKHVVPNKKQIVIKKDFPCMPCYHTHCDKGYICMNYITPEEVYNAITELLNLKQPAKTG